jgi:redox-sensitive bicupin YhaK (pirin superfamily)
MKPVTDRTAPAAGAKDLNQAGRAIVYRTRGRGHGGITRLASPGDAGNIMKPFVFLDLFDLDASGVKMGLHPHSGIATVTVVLDGVVEYRETTGNEGLLPAGAVEWMSAGNGVWHGGGTVEGATVRGFQLWLALPPEDENAPSHSLYLAPEDVAQSGPVRVVIGSYGGVSSTIRTRASINYLAVQLKDGERWSYQPPAGHKVGWVAVADGVLETAGAALSEELAVFEQGQGQLDFVARGGTRFVLGSSVPHPHPLVTGYYSVHSSQDALDRGEAEIARQGQALRAAGML